MILLPTLLQMNHYKSTSLEKTLWLTQIFHWIQKPRSGQEKEQKIETLYTTRIKYLLQLLKGTPDWQEHFVVVASEILLNISSPFELSNAGLSSHTSFQQDFMIRLQDKLLPAMPISEDLFQLITEIFPDEQESQFVDFIDPTVLSEFLGLFADDHELLFQLKRNSLLAAHSLSLEVLMQAQSILKSLDFKNKPILSLAEFNLESQLRLHCQTVEKSMDDNNTISAELDAQKVFDYLNSLKLEEVFLSLISAEYHLEKLTDKMQERGVKIDLVYDLQSQKRKLNRLRLLLNFLKPKESQTLNIRLFVSQIILDAHHQKSLISFLSENLTLLTKRIVQANSHQGEHYVTYHWQEFRKMFFSAGGGGALTAWTVFAKFFLANLKLTGFIKGLADSLNYSSSFLVLQLLGFTLATKQPSSTAPFLASALKKSLTEARLAIVALLRTQFIAVIGNLAMVFPICLAVSWLALLLGYPIFDQSQVLQNVQSSNILGPSPLFAAFTGILLFSASLFAGWFENFCHINYLQERIQSNYRLIKWLGKPRTERLADFIGNNSNSLAGSISLGFLLGLSPQLIKFIGVPLEVRHVTLATGSLAASIPQALSENISAYDWTNAVLGIFAIGIVNISISFMMAFFLASISSQISFKSLFKILKWGVILIFTKPWLLVVPEKIENEKT